MSLEAAHCAAFVLMREFLQKPAGKIIAVVVVLIGLGAIGYSMFGGADVVSQARDQIFVDASTGQSFPHELIKGEVPPVMAPSGKKAGYPSEKCFWTEDGHVKATPDYVLMNDFIGKPGPTFCPVCHRLVVAHNPPAVDGAKPPPTMAEYATRHPVVDTR